MGQIDETDIDKLKKIKSKIVGSEYLEKIAKSEMKIRDKNKKQKNTKQ